MCECACADSLFVLVSTHAYFSECLVLSGRARERMHTHLLELSGKGPEKVEHVYIPVNPSTWVGGWVGG